MREIDYKARVISDYIYHRTRKRVQINTIQNNWSKLEQAYMYAITWFQFNNIA